MDLLPCLMIQVRFFMEPLYLCGQGSKFMTRLLWSSWQVSELAEDVRTEHAALRDTSSTAMSDHGWILQLDLSRWVLKSLTLHSDPGLPFACTKVSVSERYTEVLGNKSRKINKIWNYVTLFYNLTVSDVERPNLQPVLIQKASTILDPVSVLACWEVSVCRGPQVYYGKVQFSFWSRTIQFPIAGSQQCSTAVKKRVIKNFKLTASRHVCTAVSVIACSCEGKKILSCNLSLVQVMAMNKLLNMHKCFTVPYL